MFFLFSLRWQSFLDVVVELEKQDKVSSRSVSLVEECLRDIGRVDLAKKVNAYKMSGESVFIFKLGFSIWQRKKKKIPTQNTHMTYLDLGIKWGTENEWRDIVPQPPPHVLHNFEWNASIR